MQSEQLSAALLAMEGEHRRRQRHVLETPQQPEVVVDGKPYLAFASNDYLGLANHPALIAAAQQGLARWGLGGGSSHLVSGHFAAHEEAEQALARFVRCEAALLFGSGYAANLAVIASLVGRGDAVFANRLNHASLNDGCVLSRATFKRFRHNDLTHLRQLLESTPARRRLIAVDAVYSMDGDEAPLKGLLELAEAYDAWLYVDDAHGFGVLGEGHGSLVDAGLSSPRLIYMATLGKAAGVAGAFVAGTELLVEWLVNSARTYIFTTAQPPALAEAVKASLTLIAEESWRRERLQQLVACMQQLMTGSYYRLNASRTAIQPLIIGSNEQALSLAERLRQAGFWVPAIRPPTVPQGTARLRVSLSAAHTLPQLEALRHSVLQSAGGQEV